MYDNESIYKTLSFAIPVESIIQVYPEIKGKNPGLRKFNNFLQAIEKSGSAIYDRFADAYVAPIEYDDIEKILTNSRCVFITGSPEYGKTYTAIKFLWEYYNTEHIPKFINKGSKEANYVIKNY